MSDRLAISAALSVLMMAIFVLFGSEDARVPSLGDSLAAPVSISAPDLTVEADEFLPRLR